MRTSDFFSGLGGFSEGAIQAGADVRFAANHNDLACEYHLLNHPGVRVEQQDLQQCDMSDIESPDLLVASPCCQGWSTAGAPSRQGTGGNGFVDPKRATKRTELQRSTMWAVTAAAEVARPHAILIENVTEMLGWTLFPVWQMALETLGYAVETQVLNAADYGSASDRKRAIVTAVQGNVGLKLAKSWGAGREDGKRLRDCIDLSYEGKFWNTIESKPARTRELIRSRQASSGLREGILNNVGDGVRMRSFDDLSPTLTTQSGTQLMHVQGDRVRIINPGELASIMGWGDDVKLPANRKAASRLIGNAIPVELAQGICEQVNV